MGDPQNTNLLLWHHRWILKGVVFLFLFLASLAPSDPLVQNHHHVLLGISLGHFTQDNFYKQNPKNLLVGGEYQWEVKTGLERNLVLGVGGVLGVVSLNKEPEGTLQYINGGLKLGVEWVREEKVQLKLFTATQVYRSFGNPLVGYNTLLGQGLEAQASFYLPNEWQIGVIGSWTPILSAGVGLFSNHRELAGHLMVSHKKVGAFGGISDLRLLKNPGPLHFQAFRLGAFFRF